MRLHIGCGTVYLQGWLNIDMPSETTFLASERPDLVKRWITTDDAYYAKHQDKTKASVTRGPLHQEMVCDQFGSFANLCFKENSISEVLARHCFEHLSPTEAHEALRRLYPMMTKGGVLRLDVPDHEKSMEMLMETRDRFYVRHLLGPRRNDYGYHMCSYSRERLKRLVEDHGFKYESEEPNIHFYPAITLRFTK